MYSRIEINYFIHNKFKNNVLPRIPDLITSYLIDNPDKIDLYFDKNLNVDSILKYLASAFKETKNIKLLDEIVKYVEVHNET